VKIDFGDFVEEVAEAVVKEATIDLHSKLKLYEAASRGGLGTPVDSGVLIGNWQMTLDNPRQGRVFNNTVYAGPVITGENLPSSWGGKYRTRQGTQVNYHESILEEVADKDMPKIVSRAVRRLG
jgi:hypothetical protein|tara:strand:+ start:629 stop:1000 length:372 start_codon:yes stop_codon:yes gene_type:complete